MRTSATLLYILKAHSDEVGLLKFSPDGKTLASADDEVITLWDANTGVLRSTTEDQDDIFFDMTISPDSKRIASASSNGYARIWNLETGDMEHTMSVEDERMLAVAFSPDGKLLATGSEVVQLWNIDTSMLQQRLLGPGDQASLSLEAMWYRNEYPAEVSEISFSPDGNTLVSGCVDTNTVRLWNTRTWTLKHTLQGYTADFSPNGLCLAVAVNDYTAIQIYETVTWQLQSTIENRGQELCSPMFSPDSKVIATYSGRHITLWDVKSGILLRSFKGHERKVSAIAFSPDGKILISGAGNCSVGVWDVESGECSLILEHEDGARNPWAGCVRDGPSAFEVLFDGGGGKVAIAFPDGSVRVWDMRWSEA